MRSFALALAAVALSGCAAKTVYLLADGRAPVSDPVLNQQFEMDRTVCQGELQKANLSGSLRDWGIERGAAVSQVGQGCMAEKGYVMVREDQAAAKQQELAAIAAEKAQRAVATPPPPLTPTHQAALKPKQPVKPASAGHAELAAPSRVARQECRCNFRAFSS